MHDFCALLLFAILINVSGTNIPCASRWGDQGYICVCNATYCDTIERPSRLPSGQFHLYTTSNSTPGFSHSSGSFTTYMTPSSDDEIVFSIDTRVQYQEIRGFGGSFSDSVGVNINSLPADAQDKLIESYFGTTGIEYNFCRTPIGGSDFSPRTYSLDDFPDDKDLQHFSLTKEDYKYKIPYIQKAKAVSERGITLYGCSWDAPQWMKTKFQSLSDKSGYLRSSYLKSWADYHVRFIQAYKENGIDIWGVSGGNEVVFPLMVGMSLNNTVSLAHDQRVWLKDFLMPSLRAANLSDVKFLALDDMRIYAVYWMERFADDPEAYKLVEGIALHWYLDYFTPPVFLDTFHSLYPDKTILYTETSINMIFGEKAVELGSWNRGALYIYNIIENLNHWTSGYIDWNLVLDTNGGPTLSNSIDAAVIVNSTSGEFYKQPIYYGMGHFSKFIPPGSKRVQVTSNQNVSSTLDENDFNQNLEELLMLTKLGQIHSSFPIPQVVVPPVVVCLATTNSDDSYTAIVFSNKNVTSRVRLEVPQVGSISLDIEPYSINSFVYWL